MQNAHVLAYIFHDLRHSHVTVTFKDSASLADTPAPTKTGLGLGVGLADLTENTTFSIKYEVSTSQLQTSSLLSPR